MSDPRVPNTFPPAPSNRLHSLDAFRGLTIASMLLVNNPGDWAHIFPQLEHAEWNGWTFTDLVFPSFLWIVGVSMTLSFARRIEQGADKRTLMLHAARRAGLIFLVGFLIAYLPRLDLATVRIPGVLQRIAVCYLIASAIFLTNKTRGILLWIVGLLSVYWILMMLVPVPGHGAGVLTKDGNFAAWVDSQLLAGHMWRETRTWDPEGIVSTLPAIATTLFGITCGLLLRTSLTQAEKTAWIFFTGAGLMVCGAILNIWMPINKSLWTCSYAVLMAGIAYSAFAFFYWIIDVQKRASWARPLIVYGSNAIAIYVMSDIIAIMLPRLGWQEPVYAIYKAAAPPRIASLLFAVSHVLVLGAFAWALHRKRWFVRL